MVFGCEDATIVSDTPPNLCRLWEVDERLLRFDGIIKRNEQADLYRHSVVKRNNAQGMHGLQEGVREREEFTAASPLSINSLHNRSLAWLQRSADL